MFLILFSIFLVIFFVLYLSLFIPRVRVLFHRHRVFNYFTRKHPARHSVENALISAGSMSSVVPMPGQIMQVDFREVSKRPSLIARLNSGSLSSSSTSSSSSSSAEGDQPAADASVRVVTWNIEFGYCLAQLVSELRRLDADIICLQEVDSFRDVANAFSVECLNYIAKEIGMCGVWAPCHSYGQSMGPSYGAWGCAILSKFDIVDPENISFTHVENYPRSAIGAIVKSPLGDICVYSLHLEVCCGLSTRLEQLQQIARHWTFYFEAKAQTAIFCGDFNTIGHGLIRLSPFHCTDQYRWSQMGSTESQMLQRALEEGAVPAFKEFQDPFDKVNEVTMSLWFMQAKLDWMLMRRVRRLVDQRCQPVAEMGQSDHGWCLVDLVPEPNGPPTPNSGNGARVAGFGAGLTPVAAAKLASNR